MQKRNPLLFDEVYLKNYKEFIKVDNRYYGGDQTWLSETNHISKFWSDRSCGVIAAYNALHYISKSELLTITKEEFVEQALLLYKYITPRVYGIPTLARMRRGLKKHAKYNNIEIITYSFRRPFCVLDVVDYIQNGLKDDSPIMMLTWNTKIPNLAYHWVTITGYYMSSNGDYYAVISNYGEKESININQWVKEKSIYKGLLYFTMKDY